MNAPILIVGAGPVGLTLACLLRRNGIECRVVDAADGPTPPHQSRALGIHARTLEVLEDLGVAAALVARGRKVSAVNAYEHGRRFARFEFDFHGLGTPYPYILILCQGETEQALLDVLHSLGGSVEWQTELKDLRQDDCLVTATLSSANGRIHQTQAEWVVGCDGAHSAVRHSLGLAFQGAQYTERFLLADVELDWSRAADEAHLLLAKGGLMPAIPLPQPGHWRLIDATGDSDAERDDDIVARFRELLSIAGFPAARLERATWTSAFRIHRRIVDRLRVGRCFLAGDAAHIHSPVGGQGMNTGIQDAHNLAWKLARAVNSRTAADRLLDSYQDERLPVARSVLRGTDWATRIVMLRNPLARAARNGLAGLLVRRRFATRRVTRQLSELDIHYRTSGLVAEDWQAQRSTSAPRPGDRVPDVEPITGPRGERRLFDVLRGDRHTLLLFDGVDDRPPHSVATGDSIQAQLAEDWLDQIHVYRVVRSTDTTTHDAGAAERILDIEHQLHERFGVRSSCLYLVRPDGYVGYRASPPTPERLASYLRSAFPPGSDP